LITQRHILRVPPAPYSPDFEPSDFWLFDHLKNSLVNWTFDEPEELLHGITSFLEEVQRSKLQAVSSHWVYSARWALENNGDYDHL
jgi:hypothetical protein